MAKSNHKDVITESKWMDLQQVLSLFSLDSTNAAYTLDLVQFYIRNRHNSKVTSAIYLNFTLRSSSFTYEGLKSEIQSWVRVRKSSSIEFVVYPKWKYLMIYSQLVIHCDYARENLRPGTGLWPAEYHLSYRPILKMVDLLKFKMR